MDLVLTIFSENSQLFNQPLPLELLADGVVVARGTLNDGRVTFTLADDKRDAVLAVRADREMLAQARSS